MRGRVETDVKLFAQAFKGTWNWRWKWGKNCHTVQRRMMSALGFRRSTDKTVPWLRNPDREAEAIGTRAESRKAFAAYHGQAAALSLDGLDPSVVTVPGLRLLRPADLDAILLDLRCTPSKLNDALETILGPPARVFRLSPDGVAQAFVEVGRLDRIRFLKVDLQDLFGLGSDRRAGILAALKTTPDALNDALVRHCGGDASARVFHDSDLPG